MRFSQKLATFISALFGAVVLFSMFCHVAYGQVPTELIEVVSPPFSIVISGYFIKAGVENYEKIKRSEF